jgi:hypothetical protein
MPKKTPYRVELRDGDITKVSAGTYKAFQQALNKLVSEAGATGFRIICEDEKMRVLYTGEEHAP